jgi:hypothetical protein
MQFKCYKCGDDAFWVSIQSRARFSGELSAFSLQQLHQDPTCYIQCERCGCTWVFGAINAAETAICSGKGFSSETEVE